MNEKFEPACAHCCYFKPGDTLTGICHRFPPVFTGEGAQRENHHWRFPVVSVHAWCGEFLLSEAA